MALPLEEANRIVSEINQYESYHAEIADSENSILVTVRDQDDEAFRFNSSGLKKFFTIFSRWSVSIKVHEGRLSIIIW
jgi:hypothetical protein